MAQKQEFHQQQQLAQQQNASSVQILLSALVEMPLVNLEERVKIELLDNEALEMSESEWDKDFDEHFAQQDATDERINDALGDYATMDDVPESLREAHHNREENVMFLPIADVEDAYEDLYKQIAELELTAEEKKILRYLVASLDEQGFLTKDNESLCDELSFNEYIYVSPDELERLIVRLQHLEPRGIAARNLQECLLAQLPKSSRSREVVASCFDELLHAQWARIGKLLSIGEEEMRQVRHEIAQLNPRPGSALSDGVRTMEQPIIPDFRLNIDEDQHISVVQNRGEVPDLQISPAFMDTLLRYRKAQERTAQDGKPIPLSKEQEEQLIYARQKVESAQTFIESMRRRRETLQRVMQVIVQLQRDFFLKDDDELALKPMVLKDVAELAAVDISTVSRAVNSKYVETNYGIYPLRYFFSTQFATADGEMIAARQVKAAIAQMIAEEDKQKPFSDEVIAQRLAQQGFKVARRTVSKYREQLGIAKASLRK